MARKSRKNPEAAPVKDTQKPMFYAGAYIRLSVVDRKQKGESIENQQAIINSFVAGRDDIELRECYIDNGFSGQSFERPAFLRMIADLESGRINCCITKDLSRLGRNAIDSGYYIERHFPSLGVRYIAVTDDYDSADGQSGGIMLSLKNMINESYALDASRKVKAIIQMNVRKGNFVGGSAPYGYFKSDNDCHKLVIDECAAQVVRKMFEMAAGGETHRAILDWLNAGGNLPPKRYLYSKGLATENEVGVNTLWWGMRAVKDMLRNRMYCGEMVQGKHRVVGSENTRVAKSEWVVVENTHEAIVSRELFDTVQRSFAKADGTKEPYFKSPNTENVFARKVFCGDCGYAIARKRLSEKSYCYKCNTQHLYSKQACVGTKMSESALKSEMLKLIREYAPRLERALPPSANTESESGEAKKELASAQSEFNRNKRFLEGLYESLVNGDISDAEYKELKSDYEMKVASLAERLKRLREEIHIRAAQEAAFAKAHESAQRLERVSDLTAEIVGRLVERITLHPGGRIEVQFSFLDEPVFNKEEGAENE
jgi:DNA invertase Pin-like site-specific DNA recombinase